MFRTLPIQILCHPSIHTAHDVVAKLSLEYHTQLVICYVPFCSIQNISLEFYTPGSVDQHLHVHTDH